mgnify:CR=1 FL=1
MRVEAVIFDVHKTLVRVQNWVSDEEASDYLLTRGYEVSPQQLKAAHAFVAFIDYPKYGYANWRSFLKRMLWRLNVKIDEKTLEGLAELFGRTECALYPDAAEAVVRAKSHGFRTATATTIARFKFEKAMEPIKAYFDFICTGYETRCDKSDPKMYKKILETLSVKPQEAVVIGDDLQYDIVLPRKLGMHTVLLDREMKNRDSTVPDAVAKDLKEAMDIVEQLTRS